MSQPFFLNGFYSPQLPQKILQKKMEKKKKQRVIHSLCFFLFPLSSSSTFKGFWVTNKKQERKRGIHSLNARAFFLIPSTPNHLLCTPQKRFQIYFISPSNAWPYFPKGLPRHIWKIEANAHQGCLHYRPHVMFAVQRGYHFPCTTKIT